MNFTNVHLGTSIGKGPHLQETLPSKSFLLVVNSIGPLASKIYKQTNWLLSPSTLKTVTLSLSANVLPRKPALFPLTFLLKT